MNPVTEIYFFIGVILAIIAIGFAIDVKLNWLKRREQRGFEMQQPTAESVDQREETKAD